MFSASDEISISSAANTLLNWKMRREAKGKLCDAVALHNHAAALWPDMDAVARAEAVARTQKEIAS